MIIASAIYDRDWNLIHQHSNVTWYEKYLFYPMNLDEYKQQIETCDFGMAKLKNFDLYVVGNSDFIALLACKNYNQRIAYKFLHDYLRYKSWGDWTHIYYMIDKVENVKLKVEELKQETLDYVNQVTNQGTEMSELISTLDSIELVPIKKHKSCILF